MNADVLLLPTLADGFGMVISEAMSRGLCVITTNNSAGPDIINSYYDGIIISSGSKLELYNSIVYCLKNRNKVREIGENALITANKYQWKDFRKVLSNLVTEKIQSI